MLTRREFSEKGHVKFAHGVALPVHISERLTDSNIVNCSFEVWHNSTDVAVEYLLAGFHRQVAQSNGWERPAGVNKPVLPAYIWEQLTNANPLSCSFNDRPEGTYVMINYVLGEV